jgi:hypothetical protein
MNCLPWLGPLAGWAKKAGGSSRLCGFLQHMAGSVLGGRVLQLAVHPRALLQFCG